MTCGSRDFTDELLAELRAEAWRPRAWWRLIARSAGRSWRQARTRPRAAVEVTVLHVVVSLLSRGKGRVWTVVSWALAVTHLGLLGRRRSLGVADVVTLARANLPVVCAGAGRVVGLVAVASDLVDGRVARARAATSRFGQYADTFADAAFWTWFALRHEPNPVVRGAAVAAWVVPIGAITVASVARGRMVDPPRPRLLRPAAVLQAVLAVRALCRSADIRAAPNRDH